MHYFIKLSNVENMNNCYIYLLAYQQNNGVKSFKVQAFSHTCISRSILQYKVRAALKCFIIVRISEVRKTAV